MDRYFWVSTRTIRPDTREQFEQSWRPAEFPDGLVGAYVLYAEEGDDVVGISIWDSAEACDRYRRSDIEARRREAMGPFVLEGRSSFYIGRELGIQGADPVFARAHRWRANPPTPTPRRPDLVASQAVSARAQRPLRGVLCEVVDVERPQRFAELAFPRIA